METIKEGKEFTRKEHEEVDRESRCGEREVVARDLRIKYYIGRMVSCSECGFEGKIEPNDHIEYFISYESGKHMRCPNCRSWIDV